jgi:hypothetical protein
MSFLYFGFKILVSQRQRSPNGKISVSYLRSDKLFVVFYYHLTFHNIAQQIGKIIRNNLSLSKVTLHSINIYLAYFWLSLSHYNTLYHIPVIFIITVRQSVSSVACFALYSCCKMSISSGLALANGCSKKPFFFCQQDNRPAAPSRTTN